MMKRAALTLLLCLIVGALCAVFLYLAGANLFG